MIKWIFYLFPLFFLLQPTAWAQSEFGLLSTELSPQEDSSYYVDQAEKYFKTMESSVPLRIKPNYSDRVVRWEWHPWLLLTGYKRNNLILTDIFLKLQKTKYDKLDCRFFEHQPFSRCHVIFDYDGTKCPIYEEFTFNNQGEITFIEAWSDYEGRLPMKIEDTWAERDGVSRLSTRVPGLGDETGRISRHAPWMLEAAKKDADLSNLLKRLKHPFFQYVKELATHYKDVLKGCSPPVLPDPSLPSLDNTSF